MKQNVSVDKAMIEYRKNFYNVYHRTIAPLFKKYEGERKNQILMLYIIIPILIFVAFITGNNIFNEKNAYSLSGMTYIISGILFIISIVVVLILPFYLNSRFVKKLKEECMPQILKLFGNITWFNGVHLVDDTELDRSDLFAAYNRRSTDDSFIGNYDGVNFKICETHMERETGSGKHRHIINIFKGVVIKFDANKIIRNKTIVATRGDMYIKPTSMWSIVCSALFLGLYIFSSLTKDNSTGNIIFNAIFAVIIVVIVILLTINSRKNEEILNEIKLEDPEFSTKYKAYSSDQVEGRYLITPAFMERFNNIETAFGTNKVKCSFHDNSLMFAISTNKNLFEIGNLFYSLENPKQLEVFFNELTSIFMLIDYFKLNEKTGL